MMDASTRARVAVVAFVCGVLMSHGAVAAAPVEPGNLQCAALDAVRTQLASRREALIRGAKEEDLPDVDLETPLRACFRNEVHPNLVRAEADEKIVFASISDYLRWRRAVEIWDIGEKFKSESAQATQSMEKGLVHAYGVARDKCIARKDAAQIPVMLEIAHFAALFGYENLFPSLDEDIERCHKGPGYLMTLRWRTSSEKRGVGSDFTYRAVLRPDPKSEDGELIGKGVYGGFIVANYANCTTFKNATGDRFTVSGKLKASGMVFDGTLLGQGKHSFTYALETTDWPIKPLYGDNPFAETPEEREAIAGAGSMVSFKPISLTVPVTTTQEKTTSEGSKCAGAVTTTKDIVIRQLRPN